MNCKTKDLQAALGLCLKVAAKRTTLPILNCLRLEAANGSLSILANDLDCEIGRHVECEGDLAPVCVSARRFHDAVFYCGESVSLTIDGKHLSVTGNIKAKLATVDTQQFPASAVTGPALAVPVNDLAEGVEFARWFAAETAYGNPSLETVCILARPKSLTVQSAAGRFFGRFQRPLICANFDLLIPALQAEKFAERLREPDAMLCATDRHATIKSKLGQSSFRLAEGKYPSMVDEVFSLKVREMGVFQMDALKDAAYACASVTTDKFNAVRFTFSTAGLLLEHRESADTCSVLVPGAFGDGTLLISAEYLKKYLPRFNSHPSVKLGLLYNDNGVGGLSVEAGDYRMLLASMRDA